MKASLAIAVLLSSTLAWGQATVNENLETAQIYVDANSGSDSNPGTMSQPLQTIGKAASMAMSNNYSSVGSRVIINPGTYREAVSVVSSSRSTSLPITFEAATSGTVFVSGADVWTGWTPYSGNPSIYTQSWPFQWGLCQTVTGSPNNLEDIVLRREMIIVNGTSLTEVLALTAMRPGTFFPDEANATVYLWPPSGTDMSTATVEVATRPVLFSDQGQSGVVLRGLTFQYANSCREQVAVGINNASNVLIDTDTFRRNNADGLGMFYSQNFTVQSSVGNHNGEHGLDTAFVKYGVWQSDRASYNNWRGAQGAFYLWDTGKFLYNHNNTFNDHRALFNQGPGVWFDTDAADTTLTGLIAVGNMMNGIFVEKSEGPVTLSNSYVCGNNPQGWAPYGGVGLRNSSSVSLIGNTVFGNGFSQISIVGEAGGILVTNWETGQVYNLQTENLALSQDIVVGGPTAQVFSDGTLGGEDWNVFASTLSSDYNSWWAGPNTQAFTVPSPSFENLDLSGWQNMTAQDTNSSWTSSTSPAACNVQSQGRDYWLVADLIVPVTVSPAGVAAYNLTTMPLGGMTGTVNLSLDGLSGIPGVTASFAPSSVSTSGASVLTLTTSPSTPAGTYPFTVIGTSGSITRTVTIPLVVPTTSVRLSTTSLSFATQTLGTTSSAQAVTLTNTGTLPLAMSGISVNGSFAETDTCGASVAAGASCAISVTFSPQSLGTATGTLTLNDADPTSPQLVSLTGTGQGALVTWSPTSLTFAGQAVNTTSPAQALTLSNTGNATMTITSITANGDFAQSNNCGSSLAAGASCSVQITFTPQWVGTRNGNVTIVTNATSNPGVGLTGTGLGPLVTWTPTSLTFAGQAVNTTSPAKPLTLSNTGNAAMTIASIMANGNFAQSNNCGSSLAAGANCTVNVTFTPPSVGTKSGSVTIVTNAISNPHVTLTGTGLGPLVTWSSTSLKFAGQVVKTTSPAQPVTLSNTGNAAMTITSIATTGDFAQSNNCGSSLAAGTSCTVQITFTPQSVGTRNGSVTIATNAASNPHVSLTGTGLAP